jgi:hypothetical protein
MRTSAEQSRQNQIRIRAVMDRLLQGQIPPDGKCDIKTLARQAAVDRTAFYGTRPYAHLREEFEARLQALHLAGDLPDRRDTQIARLKDQITTLKKRLTDRDQSITELTDFRIEALSQLAAQHDEITRLRHAATDSFKIRRLPTGARPPTQAVDQP